MKRLNVIRIQAVKDGSIYYEGERITRPAQAAAAFCALVGNPDREVFAVMMLDGKNRIASIHKVSEGSLNQSIVHPREVFKAAILSNAAAIILAHNHPSGDLEPSREDREITRRLKDAGDLMGIRVLDHVICNTDTGSYRAFSEMGIL